MADYIEVSFCPRCGRRFNKQYPKSAEEIMQVHMKNCTDIAEEYRGEIDSS
ncbi:MAG: hypothetical protein HYU02_06905 [Thaumarchaeota archaeon]|nr:hypothetical protein [Nitrososphaerota archaeon]